MLEGTTKALWRALADFVADDRCHLCGAAGGGTAAMDPVRAAVCAPVDVAGVTNHPVCARCALRLETAPGVVVAGWMLPAGGVLTRAGAFVPAPAETGGESPGPVRLASAFHTGPVVLALIHRVKFGRVASIAELLARALAIAARPLVDTLADPVLVPVPMDARGLRRRGFNQAQRIAAGLGPAWRVPIVKDAVVKPAPTPPQSLAGRERRLPNILGAYRGGGADVRGRDAVIVDDLVTTGATVAVIAAVLGGAGAASVSAVSVGRAL